MPWMAYGKGTKGTNFNNLTILELDVIPKHTD